jgi:hypothetical protein
MRRLSSAFSSASRKIKRCAASPLNSLQLLVLAAVALTGGISLPGRSQQPLPTPKSAINDVPATCSSMETKAKDRLEIKCQGMNPEQGERVSAALTVVSVMNKLLEDKLDPEAVTAKLDELVQSASQVPRVKTYSCDGMWKSGSGGMLDTKTGGNDSEFLKMIGLLQRKQYSDLLSVCTANITATPGWLTPKLFCGLAYARLDRKVEAQAMLAEFEEKTGPTYDVPDCHDMHDLLRRALGK